MNKTRSQINNITLSEALVIAKANGLVINFNTRESDIKSYARNILRQERKLEMQR